MPQTRLFRYPNGDLEQMYALPCRRRADKQPSRWSDDWCGEFKPKVNHYEEARLSKAFKVAFEEQMKELRERYPHMFP